MPDPSIDKFEVTQTLSAYMQAIDAADTFALRNRVFSPDANITLLEPLGVDGYCEFVETIMQEIRTQHFVMNSVVEIDGDKATAKSYFIGFHRVSAGSASPLVEDLFGKLSEEMDVFIGGYYDDVLVRLPQGWRIHERKIQLLWENRLPAGQIFADNWISSEMN